MKLIHCADLHLDSKMTSNLSKEQARERKGEILHTFSRMVEFAVEEGVKVIIIAGDLFDTHNISMTAKNIVWDAIRLHPQIDFLYLKGNHDADNFFPTDKKLPSNLKLFSEKWQTYRYGNILISGLELSDDNAQAPYQSLNLAYEDFNIVTLHGQTSPYGGADQNHTIDLEQLKNRNIDYLALGHVHKYRREMLDGRGWYCYPGCLEGRGFDECGPKGFVFMDIDEMTHKCQDQFVPFAKRTMYAPEVDCTGIRTTSEALERVERCLVEQELPYTDLLKVVLTGQVEVEADINCDYLSELLCEKYYYAKVKDETELLVDFEDYRKDASLKGEFMRMLETAPLDEDTKKRVIRCGIMALSGEEF